MKTRRFCPMCGRPVCKSMQKKNPFRCYNCEKDFNSRVVLRIKDLPKVKKRQRIAYRNECQHGDYPHGFKRPYPSGDKNGIRCNTSGGGWLHIPPKALKYVGKEEKEFCDWGWNGACGGGAVHFKAEVSVWEYIQPNALYGKFSTKEWRRIRLDKHSEENWKKDGYLYSGSGLAFRNQEELDEFMKLYKGTIFQGVWDNSFIVWCYYEIHVGVSQEEWNRLPYPETKKHTKIHPDDKRHILYSYFFNKNIH